MLPNSWGGGRYIPPGGSGVGLGMYGLDMQRQISQTMFGLEQDRLRAGQQLLEGQLYLQQLRNQEEPGAFSRARRLLMGY